MCALRTCMCVCVCAGVCGLCGWLGDSLQFRNCVIFVRFCRKICGLEFRMPDKKIAAFIYRSRDLSEISSDSLIDSQIAYRRRDQARKRNARDDKSGRERETTTTTRAQRKLRQVTKWLANPTIFENNEKSEPKEEEEEDVEEEEEEEKEPEHCRLSATTI